MSASLTDRIALVTGASRGIGASIALALARAGAHVVAVARTQGGLEELDDAIRAEGGSATLVPLDLKDYEGIDRLGRALYERYGRLDILVGNAGVLGGTSPLAHVEPKAWDDAVTINLTANWRLVRSMDMLLRASDAARAVFVTSGATVRVRAYWGPYAVTKAGLEVLARTYAAETATTPVKVNLFNPGATRTRMRADAMPGEDPMTLPTPDEVAAHVVPLCQPSFEQTGLLYNYPTRQLMTFQPPSPVA